VITYQVDPVETAALLQTKSDDYKYVEEKEEVEEIFTVYKGAVGDEISKDVLPTLNAMANGTAKEGTPFSAVVKTDGTGIDKVVAVDYEGEKAFFFNDERSSPLNTFYTESGAAAVKSNYRFPVGGNYRKTDGFGMRSHPVLKRAKMHNGVDYAAAAGTPVVSVADGVVIESTFSSTAGNYVVIRHTGGLTSHYLHLKDRGIRNGSNVKAGQVIGKVGSTGISTGPHLHFGVKKNNEWQNPERVLGTMVAAPQLSENKLPAFKTQVKKVFSFLR